MIIIKEHLSQQRGMYMLFFQPNDGEIQETTLLATDEVIWDKPNKHLFILRNGGKMLWQNREEKKFILFSHQDFTHFAEGMSEASPSKIVIKGWAQIENGMEKIYFFH